MMIKNINLIKEIIINTNNGIKTFNLSLAWIIGFWEGDGSLTIQFKPSITNKTGIQVILIWEIHQHVIDKDLLEAISIFLGSFFDIIKDKNLMSLNSNNKKLGKVEISSKVGKSDSWVYRLRISTQKDIFTTLLPILIEVKNNLLLKKRQNDLNIFIEACLFVKEGKHNSIEGLKYLQTLTKNLSNKKTYLEKYNLPDISNVSINKQSNNILGFTDSEGSFGITVYSYGKDKEKKSVNFSFKITQTGSESLFLNKLIEFFGCGKVYLTKNDALSSTELTKGYYTVYKKEDLINKIIPFFNQNKLLAPLFCPEGARSYY